MDYIQIVNLNELRAFNKAIVEARIATEHHEKALKWLNHNVLNSIEDVARQCVDTWFGREERLYEHRADIRYHYLATARTVQHRKMEVRRLDLYKLSAEHRKAYDEGAVLIGLHAFEAYGETVVHFMEALCAKMGRKKNWDSIDLRTATSIAEAWVKELQARAVASGGQVREIGVFQGFTLVKLEDQDAYVSEGKVMHHCVADSWGKTSEIYSLRKGEERYATIEVRGATVVQAKGKWNIDPKLHETEGDAVGKALTAAYFTLNWKQGNYRSPGIEIRGIDYGVHVHAAPPVWNTPPLDPFIAWPMYSEVFQFDRVLFLDSNNERLAFSTGALGRFVAPEANGGIPLLLMRSSDGAAYPEMRAAQRIVFLDGGLTLDVSRSTRSEIEIEVMLNASAIHAILSAHSVYTRSTVKTVADNWGRNIFGMKVE